MSCDQTDSVIYDECSLKSGVAKMIISKLEIVAPVKSSSNVLERIFNEEENEKFIQNMCILLKDIRSYVKEKNKFKAPKIVFETNIGHSARSSGEIPEQLSERDNCFTFNNTIASRRDTDEQRILYTIMKVLDKFDSGGGKLLNYFGDNSQLNRIGINDFFNNLLVWGSYKIADSIATDKIIIFRAVSKKFTILIQKLIKISSNDKYTYSPHLKEVFKNLVDSFLKIESYMVKLIFKNYTVLLPKITETSPRTKEESNENSISCTVDSINLDSYKTAEISDFIKNMNVGHLIPISCGHDGNYSASELDIFNLYLVDSKFIS